MRLRFLIAVLSTVLAQPSCALAWGYEGHQVIALIARAYMTPTALAKVDALLRTDGPSSLTAHDMASEATWADAFRGAGHNQTAAWHFVDIELDHPDVSSACFGFPPSGTPPSSGPAQACIIDKLNAFEGALSNPATAPDERLLALKYVLHFVGDIHQPLHAGDNHDRGGNCVALALGGPRTQTLHSYWDTGVVEALGGDPFAVSKALIASISPADARRWAAGAPIEWAQESFELARTRVYTLGSPPGCDQNHGPIAWAPSYPDEARRTAALQLKKAGVRLAFVLNRAVGP